MADKEFTTAQLEQIDNVQNAAYDLLKTLYIKSKETEPEELEWDMGLIGELADAAAEILKGHGHAAYYPYRETDKKENTEIHDYDKPEQEEK